LFYSSTVFLCVPHSDTGATDILGVQNRDPLQTAAHPGRKIAVLGTVGATRVVMGLVGVTIVLEHFTAKWEPVRRRKCDH